jgi:hypothetical protein
MVSCRALRFSSSLAAEKLALPKRTWTMPARSARNSSLPALNSLMAPPRSVVGHQAAGTEHPAELGHLGHHVGGGDQQIEIDRATGDLLDQLIIAGQVGAGGLGLGHLLTAGDHGDAHGLAGAVGQGHGGAQLLVGVLGVDAEAHVGFDRLVEAGGGVVLDQLEGLERFVGAVLDLGGEGGEAFGDFCHGDKGCGRPWRVSPEKVKRTVNGRERRPVAVSP